MLKIRGVKNIVCFLDYFDTGPCYSENCSIGIRTTHANFRAARIMSI